MIEYQLTPLVHWLADVYMLSTVLLLAGLAVMSRFRQPSRRMAVSQSVAVGLVALTVLATAPGWPRIAAVGRQATEPAVVPGAATPALFGEAVPGTSAERGPMRVAMDQPADPVNVAPRGAVLVPEPRSLLEPRRPPSWRSVIGVAFATGAILNLVWLVLGAIQAACLRYSVRAPAPRLEPLLTRVFHDLARAPRVCLSARIGLPVAVGMVRPMIVLPERFAETETDDCLEAALAHEWAHIRNGDLRWLALLRLLNVVLFAQPFFWWLRRAVRADQEALADAAASSLHGDGRLAYAETLVGWARFSHRRNPGALASGALALWERPSMLHRRVCLLLDNDYRIEHTISRRWKLGAACLSMLGALLLSTVTLRPSAATTQDMKTQSKDERFAAVVSGSSNATGERLEYAGRVLDPEGGPVAGAKLHLAYFGYDGKAPPAIRATSGAGGRFRIDVSKNDFVDTTYDSPWTTTQVVATVPGFGLGWADAAKKEDANVDPRNLTIRLARGDAPISGRIVDLEGRPVAGATIRHVEILEPGQGDLSAWIAASIAGSGGSYEVEREYLNRKLWPRGSGLPVAITTDDDGRFSIAAIGRERLVRLNISGPTIQTKEIGVLTRAIAPFQVNHGRGSPDWGIAVYYGQSFTHAAAPTKPVIGIVKDKDTGKPLAGVRIASDRTAEFPVHGFNGIETTSDQDGRYQLTGLPKGRGNHVVAIPAKGQPYLASGIDIPDAPALEPVVLDIGMKRGIVIEGRIIDKASGKPLKAYVAYNAYKDNPQVSEAPGFTNARVWGQYKTEPDGSFHVVGLPGRGLIAALYIGGGKQYLTGMGLPKVMGRIDTLPVVPDGNLGHFNALSEVDLPADATTIHRDLALESGVTRTVRVVDPEGRPLAGARIKFQLRVTNLSTPQQKAEFQVEALRSAEVHPLVAFHESLKLAGSVDVHAEQEGITVLKLEPWGTLVGRLVDDDGGARAKVDIVYSERHDYPVATDSQGRFRIDGLVPGKPAKVWVSPMDGFLSGTITKNLVLKPGEIKNLGDVREAK